MDVASSDLAYAYLFYMQHFMQYRTLITVDLTRNNRLYSDVGGPSALILPREL